MCICPTPIKEKRMVIRTMPYHGKHRFLVSEEEAKAIVARENKMTGKEFVDSIYAKLGIGRPERTPD